jgi:hypothetical protein
MAQLKDLSEAEEHEAVNTAQRFLTSAFEAVDAVLETLDVVRQVRKQKGGDIRGRLTANEEDLLRASVVFTGAGLDAVLKRLIRDTLPGLLGANDQAHEKFEAFARDRLGTGEIADTAMIARYLTSEDPRARLMRITSTS